MPLPRHERALLSLALGLLAALTGCRQTPPELHPVWPPPPEPPRLQHIKTLRQASDMVPPSALQKFTTFFTGEITLQMLRPQGVGVLEDRRIYITDMERQGLLILDLKSGKTSLVPQAGNTYFISPVAVVLCGQEVAVSDSVLKKVYILNLDGTLLRTIDKPGGFQRPTGLAYDASNADLYVVDTLANEICVFDCASGQLRRRFGKAGRDPGQFNYPTQIFLDSRGRLYVTDSLNFRVQVLNLRGQYLLEIGKHGDASGHLGVPKGVGVDSLGQIYITDSYLGTLQVFDQRGRFLLGIGDSGDGPGAFRVPTGLTVDSHNRIYICDSFHMRLQILQYVGESRNEPTTQPASAP